MWQVLAGDHGIVVEVRMPPLDEQAAHDLLHLDFALGCPGVLWVATQVQYSLSCLKFIPK